MGTALTGLETANRGRCWGRRAAASGVTARRCVLRAVCACSAQVQQLQGEHLHGLRLHGPRPDRPHGPPQPQAPCPRGDSQRTQRLAVTPVMGLHLCPQPLLAESSGSCGQMLYSVVHDATASSSQHCAAAQLSSVHEGGGRLCLVAHCCCSACRLDRCYSQAPELRRMRTAPVTLMTGLHLRAGW